MNQQCAVYQFKCDFCVTHYVGYSCPNQPVWLVGLDARGILKNGGSTTKHRSLGLCRHLHQRIEEHKGTAIECQMHLKEQHGKNPKDIAKNFRIFKMLCIRMLKPKLNRQCDSMRAKVCVQVLVSMLFNSLYLFKLVIKITSTFEVFAG